MFFMAGRKTYQANPRVRHQHAYSTVEVTENFYGTNTFELVRLTEMS